MYSIAEIKGKQYKLEPGEVITIDYLNQKKETEFNDIKVLLYKNDKNEVQIGNPYLDNIKVQAQVLDSFKGKKIKVVKFKRKKGYVRTHGHRQRYSNLKIVGIKVS